MFQAARLHLTALYMLITLIFSGAFSFAIYNGATFELSRGLAIQAVRYQQAMPITPDDETTPSARQPTGGPYRGGDVLFFSRPMPIAAIDNDLYMEARQRILTQLLVLNLALAAIAGVVGYFLAGRTLEPIEDMLEEQKRFVSDASHELRTPLTALRTEMEVGLRQKKIAEKDARDLLASNLEEIAKMQKLSEHLLLLSRYEDERKDENFSEKVSLQDIVQRSIEERQTQIETKSIKVTEKFAVDLFVQGNSVLLQQLLSILLDNAIKYSHSGKEILITGTQKNGRVVLQIRDHGIGIKAGDIPYIFQRFYRADTSRTKTMTDGYGLGLSIAHRIVELHGARISVKSEPGKGSTFLVEFPPAGQPRWLTKLLEFHR